jgi:predicted DNA-binding protein (UPF0251 family)
MVRPTKCRCVEAEPNVVYFKPRGVPLTDLDEVVLAVEEYEAIRLADLEGLEQEPAAVRMGVSRQTFGRVLETARRTIADAIINGKAIRIEGGDFVMAMRKFRCSDCGHAWEVAYGAARPAACPQCQKPSVHRAEEDRGYARAGAGRGRCRGRRGPGGPNR